MIKFKHFFILFLIIVFVLYKFNRLLIYSGSHLNDLSIPILKSSSVTIDSLDHKTGGKVFKILLWTKYFQSNDWSGLNLKHMNCSQTNCILSDKRQDLVSSDAVFFHWRDIDVNDLPKYRIPGQNWILYNWESPYYTPEQSVKPLIKNIDWIMTYRRDSDIYVPYGSVVNCHNNWQNEDLFDKKTKSIAWIVSNCKTNSKREEYVRELSKYIDVDVYGKCGQFHCQRDETCFEMIAKKYKFYLSFENSLCKDYVTEKLFRTLHYDIIPIVYGSADYSQILPKTSFINIMNFSSAEDLSKYLKMISSDKQQYNSFLKWKTSHCVRETKYTYFCKLCEKLNQNNNEVIEKGFNVSHKTDRNLIKWWFDGADCQLKNCQLAQPFQLWSKALIQYLLLSIFNYIFLSNI